MFSHALMVELNLPQPRDVTPRSPVIIPEKWKLALLHCKTQLLESNLGIGFLYNFQQVMNDILIIPQPLVSEVPLLLAPKFKDACTFLGEINKPALKPCHSIALQVLTGLPLLKEGTPKATVIK